MGAVLLSILGMAGKVFLIILILLALILFFPVSYKAVIQKHQEHFYVHVKVSWLFRFVYAVVKLQKHDGKTESDKDIRIAGIPVLKILSKRKKKKKPSDRKERQETVRKAHRKPTVPPGQRSTDREQNSSLPIEVIRAKRPGFLVRLGARISSFIGKIKTIYRRICRLQAVAADWLEYFGSESFRRAKDTLLREGMAILRHILPKKISGSVCFGTDDPAMTGMLLGVIAMLYPVIPEKLMIEPDFMEPGLEADLSIEGRLFLIVLIVHAVRILLSKDVRILISRILNTVRSGKGKNKADAGHKGRGKPWKKKKKTMHFRTT